MFADLSNLNADQLKLLRDCATQDPHWNEGSIATTEHEKVLDWVWKLPFTVKKDYKEEVREIAFILYKNKKDNEDS